jgi:hypothetical protein
MGIKNNLYIILLIAALSGCQKSSGTLSCENNNKVFIYSNNFFTVAPNPDSFAVNQPIDIKLDLPKKFIDEAYVRNAEYLGNEVFATLTCILLDSINNSSNILSSGALQYLNFTTTLGQLRHDSVIYDTEYFRSRNLLASAVSGQGDTVMKAAYTFKVHKKGNYALYFSFFSGKNPDCSRCRYFVSPGVNQHLHLLAAVNNGYIGDFERTYVYCFKVY